MVAGRVRLLPAPLLRFRPHLPPAYQHSDNVPVLQGHLERALLGVEHHIVLHSLTGPALEGIRELVQQVVSDEGDQGRISWRITWEVPQVYLLDAALVDVLLINIVEATAP